MKTILKINTFNIALAIFIILWGAWVRLSGSGAGCGSHWPLCNGEVIPLDPSLKTLTELFHRLTTGVFGITVIANCYFSFKNFGKSHLVTKANLLVFIITIIESLIGAFLVKKGLVAKDTSHMRAFVVGLHLINTYFLLASLVWVQDLATSGNALSKKYKFHWQSVLIVILFILVGSTGAITALGNTLFPDTSLIEGMAKDFDPNSPLLIQLRFYHPIIAGILCLSLLYWNSTLKFSQNSFLSKSFFWQIILMVTFGIINWLMMSPSWGAIIHLFLGDMLWMCFLYLEFNRD
ncbi:COX15/CtaA family protein [Bacteriovoracaceae bacterium]|nr:COX15/CtaA family protein [Bacteriovoracaceae bacterium]